MEGGGERGSMEEGREELGTSWGRKGWTDGGRRRAWEHGGRGGGAGYPRGGQDVGDGSEDGERLAALVEGAVLRDLG